MAKEFRDLNHNGTMEPYEDPSLPVAERVEDLLGRMTLEEKAGQLFHNILLPGPDGSVTEGPSGSPDPTIPATEFISNRLMTHFNLAGVMPTRRHAEWTNRVQELAADTRLGIPVTLSSDPRHGFASLGAAFAARGMSQWPEAIGLAAIGDEQLVQELRRRGAPGVRGGRISGWRCTPRPTWPPSHGGPASPAPSARTPSWPPA